MFPSEIEMFRSRTTSGYASGSNRDRILIAATDATREIVSRVCHAATRVAVVVLTCVAMLAASAAAHAANQPVPLFADRDIGDALAQAVQGLGSDTRHVLIGDSAMKAACAAAPGATPRLALLTRDPSRTQIEACSQTAVAEVSTIRIGRQAVALVVPESSPIWSISAAALFRAVGQNGDEKPQPNNWSDVDPGYPHLPIGMLLPAAGSRARRLLDTLILAPGCESSGNVRMPFDLKNRITFCSSMRSDIPILQRQAGASAVATWAASASPGQIAVVTIGELRELDRRVVPLPLDGALPTAANIESGRYPAAEQVELLIVVPHAADQAQRGNARALAFDLLAEASIGPTGSLTPAGLIPLPPTDRIAARSHAVALLEQP